MIPLESLQSVRESASLGDEVRSEVAKILARFSGLDIAAVKVSTISKVALYIEHLEARVAAQPEEPEAYQVRTKNTPLDAHFQLRRLKRMRSEDEQFINARML